MPHLNDWQEIRLSSPADEDADLSAVTLGEAGSRLIPLGSAPVSSPQDQAFLAERAPLFCAENLISNSAQFSLLEQGRIVMHPACMGAAVTANANLLQATFSTQLLYLDNAPIRVSENRHFLDPGLSTILHKDPAISPLCNLYFAYFHWIVEVLPALFSSCEMLPEDFRIICPRPVPGSYRFGTSLIEDSVRLCGIDPARLLYLDSGLHEFPRLVVPKVRQYWNYRWADTIVANAAKGARPDFPKRIYISRRDTTQRHVTNESELASVLAEHGVEPVVLSDYSFQEQVQIFSQVELVVAPHGGGLTNLVFAPSTTVVIEAIPRSDPRPWFWHVAGTRKQQYIALLCESGNDAATDMKLDCSTLARLLAEMQ